MSLAEQVLDLFEMEQGKFNKHYAKALSISPNSISSDRQSNQLYLKNAAKQYHGLDFDSKEPINYSNPKIKAMRQDLDNMRRERHTSGEPTPDRKHRIRRTGASYDLLTPSSSLEQKAQKHVSKIVKKNQSPYTVTKNGKILAHQDYLDFTTDVSKTFPDSHKLKTSPAFSIK